MENDYDIWIELEELRQTLDKTIEQFYKAGIDLASAESKYTIALRKEALKQRSDGLAVSFITQFVKGVEDIADLRQKRDNAEALHDALEEKINSIKLQMRILDAQITREWGRGNV